MTLTSILAIAFGAFGTNSNGGVLYHNTLTFSSGVACVGTIKNSTSYAGAFYEVKGSFDVDFYYVRDEEENTMDLAIKFNSAQMTLWTYPVNSETPNRVSWTSTSTYLTNFEDSVIADPNNNFGVSIYFNTQTTTSGTLTCYCEYYDHYTDEPNGIFGSFTNASLGSSLLAKQINNYKVNFDLDNLIQQVENAMNVNAGGYAGGYDTGYNAGVDSGYSQGYNTGYSDGYTAGASVDDTAFTIFNGILAIGMMPINVFLAMLNWEVFGINISSFVMSILTLAITIWFIRTITGGSNKNAS